MEDVVIEKVSRLRRPFFRRESVPSPLAIGVSVFTYFFGALGVYRIDPGFLLMAWLMGGFLLLTVYMTFDARGSLLNPYTLFFAGTVLACLGGYVA